MAQPERYRLFTILCTRGQPIHHERPVKRPADHWYQWLQFEEQGESSYYDSHLLPFDEVGVVLKEASAFRTALCSAIDDYSVG